MPPGADGIGFVSNDQTAAQSIGTGSHQIKTIEMSEAQPALSARERLRQHVNRNIQMQQELARQQAEKQGNFHGQPAPSIHVKRSGPVVGLQNQASGLESLFAPIQDTRLGKQDIHSNHANPVGNLNIHPKQLTHADVLSVPINMSVDMTGPLETHYDSPADFDHANDLTETAPFIPSQEWNDPNLIDGDTSHLYYSHEECRPVPDVVDDDWVQGLYDMEGMVAES
uniref:Uncharacterized protein n=1 Tax=Hanusia phi TaxID=3032 RepID=A0A7S0HKY8_9CRYP|mmetsp:Transcript_26878/g.61321  ORF Transcript_26878/g.61321 Transcript_26878/m.61321 type:complete len:226 (+) Transcript_26878:117-794(+)